MITREDLEQREFAVLSACATKAAKSRGKGAPGRTVQYTDGFSKGQGQDNPFQSIQTSDA